MTQKKKLIILIGIVAAIIVAAAIIAVSIALVNGSKPKAQVQQQASIPSAAAEATITEISKAASTQETLKQYTLSPAVLESSKDQIYAYDAELRGSILVPANTSISINSSAPFSEESIASLASALDELLVPQGYVKNDVQAASGTISAYHNELATCNVSGIVGSSVIEVACADFAKYQGQLTTVKDIFKAWETVPTFSIVTPSIVTSKDGQYAVAQLRTIAADNTITSSSIFKKQGSGDWEFISDSAGTQPNPNSNGKVSMSEALVALSKDTNYGPLFQQVTNQAK